ncbi:hypothetical protein N7454_000286 [Penicillium verhagenii]|nr:hypothetical protein N7454_000286 [Penicillium verhagenii]
MELTWQANTPQWRSRTRAARACPTCQRRKVRRWGTKINNHKRCRHLAPISVEGQPQPRHNTNKTDTNHKAANHLDRPNPPAHCIANWQRTSSADPALQSTPQHGTICRRLEPRSFHSGRNWMRQPGIVSGTELVSGLAPHPQGVMIMMCVIREMLLAMIPFPHLRHHHPWTDG